MSRFIQLCNQLALYACVKSSSNVYCASFLGHNSTCTPLLHKPECWDKVCCTYCMHRPPRCTYDCVVCTSVTTAGLMSRDVRQCSTSMLMQMVPMVTWL
jgi:hypothetical protein